MTEIVQLANPSHHPRVLVVDDDDVVCDLVRHSLARDGVPADGVGSAAEAIHALRTHPYDMVILDLSLRGERTGMDVLGEMRRHHELDDVPVMLLSAYDDPERISFALDAGAQDYLTKPFSISELRARARTALATRRRARALARSAAQAYSRSRSLSGQLAAAAEVQRSALPSFPLALPPVSVTGDVRATEHLSGDAVAVVRDPQGRVACAVLDCAGHGLAAGIVAAAARATVTSALEQGRSLDEVVSRLRHTLLEHHDVLEAFVGLAIVRFSCRSRTIEVLNAGMPPVVMFLGVGHAVFQSRSSPIGVVERSSHPYDHVSLMGEATWLMASDGATGGSFEPRAVLELGGRLGLPSRHAAALSPAELAVAAGFDEGATDDRSLLVAHVERGTPCG